VAAAQADMLCIGLMSGTSMDGIDAALCRIGPQGQWRGVLGHLQHGFDAPLRAALMALQTPGDHELHRAALAANALARAYADVTHALLQRTATTTAAVAALGAHGQTVRHQPGLHDGAGYTLQLLNPALLAELSGIAVVSDFRSRDVAAGGQGAPLVPPFHAMALGAADEARVVVNIGGISNLTLLAPDTAPRGWDCGPGNVLMDLWSWRHQGLPFDAAGAWAASGQVVPALAQALRAEPFLDLPPPKSTGRDLFHAAWLESRLSAAAGAAPADVQATLCDFTAHTIAADVRRHASGAQRLLVCGGGALNDDLMRRLQQQLPGLVVASTDSAGLPPLQVEAAAFAWLAALRLLGLPGSRPEVTGARGPRVLGSLYPA
jgi:anhydro-N-acetylmuramic acid kinase